MENSMEKEFLTLIQKNFPVSKRPFADLARQLGSDETEVLNLF